MTSLLLLRRLWQIYDGGGHSCERSIRSTLLEGAIFLLQSVEAGDRHQSHLRNQLVLPFAGLVSLDAAELADVLLLRILDWYEQGLKLANPAAHAHERQLVQEAEKQLPLAADAQTLIEIASTIPLGHLIDECHGRKRAVAIRQAFLNWGF